MMVTTFRHPDGTPMSAQQFMEMPFGRLPEGLAEKGFGRDLNFVLTQCVRVGVEELAQEQLAPLLRLKYHAISDAAADLGDPEQIREVFVGYQPRPTFEYLPARLWRASPHCFRKNPAPFRVALVHASCHLVTSSMQAKRSPIDREPRFGTFHTVKAPARIMDFSGLDTMARHRHLARAPIVEAIFDIRVIPHAAFDAATLRTLATRIVDRYPDVEERTAFRATLRLDGSQTAPSGTENLGLDAIVLKTRDGQTLAQFRRDGFTFNRLYPYTSWEELLPEVERLWRIYLEGARPEAVSRIAVRFINRLRLPLPIEDFRQYLTAPPSVPDSVPQAMAEFLTRVTIVDQERNLAAHIAQKLEPGTDDVSVQVLLDIDAYAHREPGFRIEDIGPTFEMLRELKNDIFFGSITESTADMYA